MKHQIVPILQGGQTKNPKKCIFEGFEQKELKKPKKSKFLPKFTGFQRRKIKKPNPPKKTMRPPKKTLGWAFFKKKTGFPHPGILCSILHEKDACVPTTIFNNHIG